VYRADGLNIDDRNFVRAARMTTRAFEDLVPTEAYAPLSPTARTFTQVRLSVLVASPPQYSNFNRMPLRMEAHALGARKRRLDGLLRKPAMSATCCCIARSSLPPNAPPLLTSST